MQQTTSPSGALTKELPSNICSFPAIYSPPSRFPIPFTTLPTLNSHSISPFLCLCLFRDTIVLLLLHLLRRRRVRFSLLLLLVPLDEVVLDVLVCHFASLVQFPCCSVWAADD